MMNQPPFPLTRQVQEAHPTFYFLSAHPHKRDGGERMKLDQLYQYSLRVKLIFACSPELSDLVESTRPPRASSPPHP